MRAVRATLSVAMALAAPAAVAQQVSDTAFRPTVAAPAYPPGTGPRILLDEGHQNFHTTEGRYASFAGLLVRDGFRIAPLRGPFTRAALAEADILVIANALHPSNVNRWRLPTPSAFTNEEIAVVTAWVREGGSLLLIADHMPFPGAAEALGAAFGFRFSNGFAADTLLGMRAPLPFRRSARTLHEHPITAGRNAAERIDSVISFTGQAFTASAEVAPLLVLGPHTVSFNPDVAWEFETRTRRVDVTGWLQGGVRTFGRGRVAVFGEAAMFSAQVQGPERIPMGMNNPVAGQNPQFLLNVLHWLAGLLDAH